MANRMQINRLQVRKSDFMKKHLLIAAGVLSLTLAGCSSGLTGTEEEQKEKTEAASEEKAATNSTTSSELNQIIVIPRTYLNKDGTSSEIDTKSIEHVQVEDKQTKYTFTQKNLAEQRDEIDASIVAALQDLADGKTLDSVTKVDAYKDFAYIKITVDAKKFNEKKDPYVFDALAVPIATYQILNGIDEPKAEVVFVDSETDKTLVTKKIPADVPKE